MFMAKLKKDKYQRGSGVKIFKKRISVFAYFLFILPLAAYLMFFVYRNQKVKSVTISLDKLEQGNKTLLEEYRRLVSKYDQIAAGKDIRKYAKKKLNMFDLDTNVEAFVVADRYSIFSGSGNNSITELFGNNVDLAEVKDN